jgi:hypothetical protein
MIGDSRLVMRLNGTGDLIDDHEYPATRDELVAAYGDRTIELQNGTETIADVLGRLGPETYETAADARTALTSAVSHRAIGRRFYSDRDPTMLSEDGPTQVSF